MVRRKPKITAARLLNKPHSVTHHGVTVTDDYAWLRDPGYPDVTDAAVLAYLNAGFDEKKIGYKSFTDFVKAQSAVAELQEDGQARRVRLRDRG